MCWITLAASFSPLLISLACIFILVLITIILIEGILCTLDLLLWSDQEHRLQGALQQLRRLHQNQSHWQSS